MKKVLAILLTVLMIVSMAACAETDGTAGTTTPATTKGSDSKPADTTPADTTPAEPSLVEAAKAEGQYAYEHLTVDSYFEGSYKKALQALTLNRTLVDAQKAKAVLDDLIDANQGYWPELK